MSDVASNSMPVKLDLACGQTPREGFEGVDLYAPEAKHKVDLFKFPYPWADASVDEIHCSHFVEHLPSREVEMRDLTSHTEETHKDFLGKDFLFAFFDECHRILKPGGNMLVIVPSGQSTRGFQDPTHRRYIVHATFLYLNRDWRKMNKLDHYNVKCHFDKVNVNHTCTEELTLRSPQYQQHVFQNYWNAMVDLHATLVKP